MTQRGAVFVNLVTTYMQLVRTNNSMRPAAASSARCSQTATLFLSRHVITQNIADRVTACCLYDIVCRHAVLVGTLVQLYTFLIHT